MPFDYFDRLSAKDKRTYRASDALPNIMVPDLAELSPLVISLEEALATGKRRTVGERATMFTNALVRQLCAPKVRVFVRNVRPTESDSELHGLYTYEEGKTPTIEVWMRTAANKNVVRFRTFLRTLLHEIVHHVDFTLHGFETSFHTEGFFRRESSLMRQLSPKPPGLTVKPVKKRKPIQLALFS